MFLKLLNIAMFDLSFPSLRYQFENPAVKIFPTGATSGIIGVSSANSGFILFCYTSSFTLRKAALFPSSQLAIAARKTRFINS